ncbi:restriction endonuclease subunit S [Propionibacterium freudenreichii]|nr:restriction endonuclease subunit S [Propionibacterium freudenreichii]MDK9622461.1 restriction endonuclease subunit S [Propionibacterium freudenreichii]MDK9626250.1 restriction endonuclease subunit S [Propionibacterium freudenreichii]
MNTVAGVGGSLLRARPAHVRKIPLPLPPLDEQRRIAAILDQADAIRTKRRDQLDRLGNLVSSIFLDMFGDPVSNPRQLPTKALEDIGSLDRGVSKHRPRNDPLLLGGAHPLIQTGDVASADRYINSYHSTYSDMGLAQSRMWPAGTLCITIAANIAKTGILKFDSCFPDSIVGFLANRPLTMYVAIWLDFLQKTIEASAPQSAQKNINLRILRSLELPVPPEEELSDFLTRVTRVDSQRSRVEAALARDDELFASLQSRAFKGEL